MYADLDFWLALVKDEDWLGTRALRLLESYRGELEVSRVTFIELCLIEERFAFERERAITAILELAAYDGDVDQLYQASAYIDRGMNTFDAFHAACAGGAIISSDGIYDEVSGIERVPLESRDEDG